MAEYRIVDAEREHVAALVQNMRAEDAAEAEALGLRPRAALWRSFRRSILRRTAFIDGEIAAMWGLCGNLLSDEAMPWLATTPAVERMPVAFVKEGRRAIAEMISIRPVLRNVVPARYTKAVGLLYMLGFKLGEPEPFGPKGIIFRTFTMGA